MPSCKRRCAKPRIADTIHRPRRYGLDAPPDRLTVVGQLSRITRFHLPDRIPQTPSAPSQPHWHDQAAHGHHAIPARPESGSTQQAGCTDGRPAAGRPDGGAAQRDVAPGDASHMGHRLDTRRSRWTEHDERQLSTMVGPPGRDLHPSSTCWLKPIPHRRRAPHLCGPPVAELEQPNERYVERVNILARHADLLSPVTTAAEPGRRPRGHLAWTPVSPE
jgi:hypothetical protein